jgi:hypothetical protein
MDHPWLKQQVSLPVPSKKQANEALTGVKNLFFTHAL